MRWTDEQYQVYVRRGQPPDVSEKALQSAVVRLAQQAGYLVYFTWSSKRSPEGFPDLILAPGPTCTHVPRICYALELKTATGHVTLPQQAWLDALAQCTGVHAAVVRPADLEDLIALLRGA